MNLPDPNWQAVIIGTIAAFGLGMIWFSPVMFMKAWARGSHDLEPPASLPIMAMLVQLTGTFTLALAVGIALGAEVFVAALLVIVTPALLVAGMDLFSQKSVTAVMIDAGYILCGGALMLGAQAIF